MELEEAPLQSKRAEIWNMTGLLFLLLQLVNVYSTYKACRVSNLQFAAQMQQETTRHLQLGPDDCYMHVHISIHLLYRTNLHFTG